MNIYRVRTCQKRTQTDTFDVTVGVAENVTRAGQLALANWPTNIRKHLEVQSVELIGSVGFSQRSGK